MSGGSMEYFYHKVRDLEFNTNTPERKAFKKHLDLIADALFAIEWVDSGDYGKGEENEPILKCIGRQDVLDTLIEEGKQLIQDLERFAK